MFFGSGGIESGAVGSPTDSDSMTGIKRRGEVELEICDFARVARA